MHNTTRKQISATKRQQLFGSLWKRLCFRTQSCLFIAHCWTVTTHGMEIYSTFLPASLLNIIITFHNTSIITTIVPRLV